MILAHLQPPAIVILYLQNPRERYWGVVQAIDATGIVVKGADLGSFDGWVGQVAAGEKGPEPSIVFFPLLRVEKVLVDAAAGDAPTLSEQFERRVGRSILSYLAIEP